MPTACSRLAPSPTGALHLGNARTFLWNWALARTQSWQLVMRIEDFDGPRVRPGAAQASLETLKWLGLDWDGPALVQTDDRDPYVTAIEGLAQRGLAYPCTLSRREIAAAAPHEDDHEIPFEPSLRPPDAGRPMDFHPEEGTHWRLVVSPEAEPVSDMLRGELDCYPARECGDFVIWTVRDEPAYQLAVVVDDIRQQVTDVVRGDDLLPSAARQQLLYRHLGHPAPRWWHLPLVRGSDGRRLAKRHGDTRIDHYRDSGVPPERVVGLLAWWCGLLPERSPLSAADFRDRFDETALPSDDVVMTAEDDAWLRG
ncbi:MAG: glutamate--tRNA ligase family protein [Phycisphaerales bacterium]|nr:glutamate--tRNA ligase family protein [Phycisphaerales bacterium]